MELFFLITAIAFIFLGYMTYLINAYFSESNNFHSSSANLVRFGYFLTIMGIFLISYAFLLIDFEPNHIFLYKMSLLTAISFSSAFYNALNISFKIVNNYIEFRYNTLGFLLILLFYIVNAYIWLSRVSTIYKMSSREDSPTKRYPPLIVWFIVLCLITVFIYLISILMYDSGNTFTDILASLLILIFIIGVLYDDTFPFLTSLKLDAVIIYENLTSIKLYSKVYSSEIDEDESHIISSLFSTLNLSLGETLRSKKKLSQLYFEDKIVLISTGKHITTLVLVGSKNNIISKAITKQITTKFEKKYSNLLVSHFNEKNFTFKTNDFNNFEQEMIYFKKYFPL